MQLENLFKILVIKILFKNSQKFLFNILYRTSLYNSITFFPINLIFYEQFLINVH